MFKLWLMYAIVSVADLILTGSLLNPSTEGNPVASWIWSTFGFLGIALYKLVIVMSIYPMCLYVGTKNRLAAKCILIFAIFLTASVCMLFLYTN